MANAASLNLDQFETPVCTPPTSHNLNLWQNLLPPQRLVQNLWCTMHKDLSKSPDMECFADLAASTRKDHNIRDDSCLFMAAAWVNQHELRCFKLHPEVVHLNVASHANSDLHHLLTFSCCRTATGNSSCFPLDVVAWSKKTHISVGVPTCFESTHQPHFF